MAESVYQTEEGSIYQLKGWELNALLLESICFGGVAMAAVAWLVETWLPQVVGQAAGLVVLMCALFPGIRVMARRKGREVFFLPFLGWSLLGAAVVAGLLVLFGGGLP